MKVYFAKSNACLSRTVACVREYLRDIPGVEIVEYSGHGNYSNQPLLASDVLVVLPGPDTYGSKIKIGKGLYSQIKSFTETHPKEKVFIITDVSQLVTKVRQLQSIQLTDSTNWTNYGYLTMQEAIYELNSKISEPMRETTYDKYGNRVYVDDYGRKTDSWGNPISHSDREFEDYERRLNDVKRSAWEQEVRERSAKAAEKAPTPKQKAKSEAVGAYLNGETCIDPELNRNVYLLIG